MEPVLGSSLGWIVAVGSGVSVTVFALFLSRSEFVALRTAKSSERYNSAGRNVGPGLTAATIISQWTWSSTLLMSTNMGWKVGVSGAFWYASGATIQILLFAVIAIQVKRRASHMHTFTELVKVRFGTFTHIVMICFALATNIMVTSMLLMGGVSTIADLMGMSNITAALLIPILSCWIYTIYGGLRATFFASYIHTLVTILTLLIFTLAVYSGNGEQDLWGSPSKIHAALEGAVRHAFYDATYNNSQWASNTVGTHKFERLGGIMQNTGICHKMNQARTKTDKTCTYVARGGDNACCSALPLSLGMNQYCRANGDMNCISISSREHFKSSECGSDEICVTSFLTMGSTVGLIFGVTSIVGNFGKVFVDQSYWQSAIAAKPRSSVLGFLIGGVVWFAVPFCMATTLGLAGRALTLWKDDTGVITGHRFITADDSSNGLTPIVVVSRILGSSGAFVLLVQLFIGMTATGSSELIAVSSILTYDVYYQYINPELKSHREKLRCIFYNVFQQFTSAEAKVDLFLNPEREHDIRVSLVHTKVPVDSLQAVIDALCREGFFEHQPSPDEVSSFGLTIAAATKDGKVLVPDFYNALNKAMSSSSAEGRVLLRMSKFFICVSAVFMCLLSALMLKLDLPLEHIYMSMGCLVGSAVGPAALTILMERANGTAIAAGAIGGLGLAIVGWVVCAQQSLGEVTYDTLMSGWPWLTGNLCAIAGGATISIIGSIIKPDTQFQWSMLKERIALVDDVEPPKSVALDQDEKVRQQVRISIIASVVLALVLWIMWPVPMHLDSSVFSGGAFTIWVVLCIIWALVGGLAVIFLSTVELLKMFPCKDKVGAAGFPPTVVKIDMPHSSIAL